MNPTQSPTNPHAAGKAAHTPTPWSVRAARNDEGYGLLICDEDQTILARMDTWLGSTPEAEMEANAAFIVRACNSHAALVEALKAIREEATAYPEGGEDCFKYSLSLIAEKARAAIARATGQGGGE